MTTWILRLVLIVLPVCILLYWLILRRKAVNTGEDLSRQERAVAITGGIVFIVALIVLIFIVPFTGHSPDDVYIAPRQVDGEIVPGEFISREEAEERGLLKKDAPPPPEELEPFGD